MEGFMTLRSVLAALAFTMIVLGATTASACPWNSASSDDNQSQVASSQGSQQSTPAKPN
jgi:hypothetical protein